MHLPGELGTEQPRQLLLPLHRIPQLQRDTLPWLTTLPLRHERLPLLQRLWLPRRAPAESIPHCLQRFKQSTEWGLTLFVKERLFPEPDARLPRLD